ncbi:MAG TPA: glycosyltransferase family 9 protein, partial [Candidatus Binataceae bacterium]|nr:glycosyltransferase family 9 protein [Candidatus Binataceae bacterium]
MSVAAANEMRTPPNRILVKEVNWLGDLVISLPALRELRRAHPRAEVSVLVKRELAGFFDGMEWLDEVMPYNVGSGIARLRDQLAIVNEIRARRFDLAVLFPNSFASALWVALAGVPRRVGYAADGRALLLTDRVKRRPELAGSHQRGEWLALVRDASGSEELETGVLDWPLEVAGKNRQAVCTWLSAVRRQPGVPLVALAPGAAFGPAKEWPGEHYASLIDLIGNRYGGECVLIGGAGERGRCAEIAAQAKTPAIVAAGETSIGELIA